MSLPAPASQALVGHLGRWGVDPLGLLSEGAALGPVFSLRLWRRTVVGHSPDWNRLVLGDLHTFRSTGSMSGLTPYLSGGLVQTDEPAHRPRRRELNPSFHRTALSHLEPQIAARGRARLPVGTFDANEWTSNMIRAILSTVFFGDEFPAALLGKFLAPLDRRLPAPFVRRPRLFGHMDHALRQALDHPRPGTLVEAFAALPGGVEEARVALAAAYDTTAHTLAWLLWHLADNPSFAEPEMLPLAVEETLRLYPAGWVGSRVTSQPVTFGDAHVPGGTMVMYSPFLTHRDPSLWTDPMVFRPSRFTEPLPPWGFIPFAAGERSCLGAPLARLILRTVAREFAVGGLTRVGPAPDLRAGITLVPAGPLLLRHRPTSPGRARRSVPGAQAYVGGARP
jgi:cytochrome P450